MKTKYFVLILGIFVVFSSSAAIADVNETLTFTNFTGEEIYVELYISDYSGDHLYDIYVLPNGTSLVDFWADTIFATYSACAYGEITGNFYGCISGDITDYYNNIYFDNTGIPYKSTPSGLPTELFAFNNPYSTVVVDDTYIEAGTSCFIGSLW